MLAYLLADPASLCGLAIGDGDGLRGALGHDIRPGAIVVAGAPHGIQFIDLKLLQFHFLQFFTISTITITLKTMFAMSRIIVAIWRLLSKIYIDKGKVWDYFIPARGGCPPPALFEKLID